MKKIALIITGLAVFSSPYAGNFSNIKSSLYNPKYSLEFGGFWAKQGKDQFVYINNIIGDQFLSKNGYESNGLVGAAIFFDAYKNNIFNTSYGINAFYLANTNVTGTVTQENLYTNLAFSYSLTNWPIYFDVKTELNKKFMNKVSLTMDVGLGPNIIQAQNFKEYSLDNGVTVPDNFYGNTTQAAFSVTAGVGLKFNDALGKLPLECGYRFFYLGEGALNQTNNQVQNALKTGNSYANAVVCAITI